MAEGSCKHHRSGDIRLGAEDLLARAGLVDGLPKDHPMHWTDCEDLEIFDDEGALIFAGPRYFRCSRAECCHLVTHGMVRAGGCWCGNRRLIVAMRITKSEAEKLKQGYYPLVVWEWLAIEPLVPEDKEPGWGRTVWEVDYA
jgi:hypothetical protein